MKKQGLYFLFIFSTEAVLLAAGNGTGGHSSAGGIVHDMNILLIQLAVILFAARAGHLLFKKIQLPPVLGELVIGILIGPYLLGGIGLPGLPDGLFAMPPGDFPLTHEIFAFAAVASILHLFLVGLETDINLFLRLSTGGVLIGICGALISFGLAVTVCSRLLGLNLVHPHTLFLGVMAAGTSVGITTRVLSFRRMIYTPEGVTILEGAVIDDMLGMILMTISIGYSLTLVESGHGSFSLGDLGGILLKLLLVGVGVTTLVMLSAAKTASFLKKFKHPAIFTVLAFALALLLGVIFEMAGLASIVGAYIAGLMFSRTDIQYTLKENLEVLDNFLVPIFFTIIGMLIDLRLFANPKIITIGLIYTAIAITGKLAGCGLPSLGFKFNLLGALRIGLGMVPRGEVVFVFAGIWLSYGLIDSNIFGMAMFMTILTTLLFPPLFNLSLKSRRKSNSIELTEDKVTLTYDYPAEEITGLFARQIVTNFKNEGFFTYEKKVDCLIHQITKEHCFITMFEYPRQIIFKAHKSDLNLIKVVVHEAFHLIKHTFDQLQEVQRPSSLGVQEDEAKKKKNGIKGLIKPGNIIHRLQGETKETIIAELVEQLAAGGELEDKNQVLDELYKREESMSTGLERGLAVPHARTTAVREITVAIGIKPEGVDFNALDSQPSKIIFMIIAPIEQGNAYLEVLSSAAEFFSHQDNFDNCLKAANPAEIVEVFLLN